MRAKRRKQPSTRGAPCEMRESTSHRAVPSVWPRSVLGTSNGQVRVRLGFLARLVLQGNAGNLYLPFTKIPAAPELSSYVSVTGRCPVVTNGGVGSTHGALVGSTATCDRLSSVVMGFDNRPFANHLVAEAARGFQLGGDSPG